MLKNREGKAGEKVSKRRIGRRLWPKKNGAVASAVVVLNSLHLEAVAHAYAHQHGIDFEAADFIAKGAHIGFDLHFFDV